MTRVYGRRQVPGCVRINDADGVIHLVCETGELVACGRRVASEPWNKKPGAITGKYMNKNTMATCVQCIATALPPLVKPETYR